MHGSARLALFVLALGMLFAMPCPGMAADATFVEIQVSPNVLNLESSGIWVTVHAEIPLSHVQGLTVTLDGIPVDVVKADAHGDLVAKFELDTVKAALSPGMTTLTLCGSQTDGTPFYGEAEIRVVRVKGGR